MSLRKKWDDLLGSWLRRYVLEDPATFEHEWTVYATAFAQVCLELYCDKCAIHGAVFDPTADEWEQAFGASAKPYRWHDGTRVTLGTTRMI